MTQGWKSQGKLKAHWFSVPMGTERLFGKKEKVGWP